MAKSKLEYWTGSAWTEAITIENQNALIRIELEDSLNNAMKANITLGNAAQDPFKEGEDAHADRYGPLTSVFTDFMPIRIIETDSNVVLFHGRVYDIKNIYDKQRGNVVKLYARDHLSELADYPTDDKDAEIKVGAGTNPSILNRSQLIKHIIRDPSTDPQRSSLQISADNIAFADQLKFPSSGRAFSTDHKDSYQINSLGRQGLKAIYEIAKGDPHEVTGDITDYGYDFYGDSRFTLASVTNPALDFNYFKRGTRPIFESTPSAFKGLRVEFPIATEFSETGQKVLMLPDYDFNLPKRDLYTGATAAISRKMVINADTDDEETISRNFNLEFEILEVSSISAAFDWKNRVLVRWNSTKVDGDSSTTGDVAERLKLSGTSTVVGRIQYQSVTSGSGDPSNGKPAYILISFEPDDLDGGDIITQKKNFNALSGTVTLVGVESGSTFSYNTATGRPSASFGLIRPLRISTSDSKHVDSMRRRIASALSRSKTSRTDCTVRIIPPPFIYVDTTVSSETGSGASAIPTLAIDAQAYGFRAGMTIAKIDSTGEQTAYGYATVVSSGAITAPLNTGDWDGYTGSEARVRLYFPVRAGHYLYAKNLLANFTGYMFIKSSIYTEEPGMQATMYKGSGVNTAGSPIGLGIDPNAIQATIEGEGNKYPKEVNVPIGGLGYTFEKIDTTRTAKFTSVNQTTISWTGGRMVIGGGGLSYEVVAGSITNLSTSIDNKTNLPVVYKVVFIDPDEQTPDSSGRYVFSFILSSAYKPDHDHIVMAHARASKNSSGKAALIFDGSGLGLYGGIDAAGEDQFSSALFKKSLQPYTTDVAINVGTSGGATKNRHVNSTAGTISFADNNTISVDANTSLDLWTVSGGSSNNNAKTWYIYYKLMNTTPNPDEETSDFTLVNKAVVDRTLVYNDATSDSRGLLAICGTGDTTQTGDNLEEIAIQAFHGKGQNINADTIAANAITANAIKAGSITSTELNFTPVDSTNVIASIRASSESLIIQGNKIEIDGSTTFSSVPSTTTNATSAANALTAAGIANDDADTAQAAANAAALTANAAEDELDDIGNDNKVAPAEKPGAKTLWDAIAKEYPRLITQAGGSYSNVSTTNYAAKYALLDAYLNTTGTNTTTMFGNMATVTNITRSVWKSRWEDYYEEKQLLLNAIADQARVAADAAQTLADSKSKVFRTATEPTDANTDPVPKAGDIWIDTSTYDASSHGGSSAQLKNRTYIHDGTSSPYWILVDTADAINNATTTIKGGLIATQKIILADGGGNILKDSGVASPSSARIEMTNDYIIGYSSSGTSGNEQFRIDADDGKAHFGGGKMVLDSNGLTLTNTGTSGGYLRSGTKTYASNEAGFFIGRSNSQYQFDIGSSANYLRWSGSALSIKGTITLSDGTAEAAIKNSNTTADNVGLGNLENDNFASNGDMDAGHVGGWNLSGSAIYSSSSAYTGSTYATSGMTLKNSGSIHTPNFYITSSGNIFAQNATIHGAIAATSGTFGGVSTNGTITFNQGNAVFIGSSTTNPAITLESPGGYLAYISSGDGSVANTGNIRIDAYQIELSNYGQSGWVRKVRQIDFQSGSGNSACSITSDDDFTILTAGNLNANPILLTTGTNRLDASPISLKPGNTTALSCSIPDSGNICTTSIQKLSVTYGITGNVTGNVTGSSGSCTGNAATATSAASYTGSSLSVSSSLTMGSTLYHNGDTYTRLEYYRYGYSGYGGRQNFYVSNEAASTGSLAAQFRYHNNEGRVSFGGYSTNSAYDVYAPGDMYATTFTESDDRVKTNTAVLTNATDKIKALNPISFNWTSAWQSAMKQTDVSQYGFLSSEFKTVFPEYTKITALDLVKLSDGSYKTMEDDEADPLPDGAEKIVENIEHINSDPVIPYLVAAIKELEARIAALEA